MEDFQNTLLLGGSNQFLLLDLHHLCLLLDLLIRDFNQVLQSLLEAIPDLQLGHREPVLLRVVQRAAVFGPALVQHLALVQQFLIDLHFLSKCFLVEFL